MPKQKRSPHDARSTTMLDRVIGLRIRAARNDAEMSMQELAPYIGVTWQQLQKYEVGANRVSASRLVAIAETLDLSIGYFLEPAPKRRAA